MKIKEIETPEFAKWDKHKHWYGFFAKDEAEMQEYITQLKQTANKLLFSADGENEAHIKDCRDFVFEEIRLIEEEQDKEYAPLAHADFQDTPKTRHILSEEEIVTLFEVFSGAI